MQRVLHDGRRFWTIQLNYLRGELARTDLLTKQLQKLTVLIRMRIQSAKGILSTRGQYGLLRTYCYYYCYYCYHYCCKWILWYHTSVLCVRILVLFNKVTLRYIFISVVYEDTMCNVESCCKKLRDLTAVIALYPTCMYSYILPFILFPWHLSPQ